MTFEMSPTVFAFLVALGASGVSAWIFVWLDGRSRRRTEQLWRETLIHLKSSTAYEAQDALDRMNQRQKTMIQKGLENIRKKDDTLSDSPVDDMATDIRGDLEKQYQ